MKPFVATVCMLGLCLSVPIIGTATAAGTLMIEENPSLNCQGTSGYGALNFYLAPTHVLNTSATTQYLNCGFPQIYDTVQAIPYDRGHGLTMTFTNPGTEAQVVTCAAVVGVEGPGSTSQRMVVKSVQVEPGPAYFPVIDFLPTELPVSNTGYTPVLLNCAIPPGIKLLQVRGYQPKNF